MYNTDHMQGGPKMDCFLKIVTPAHVDIA